MNYCIALTRRASTLTRCPPSTSRCPAAAGFNFTDTCNFRLGQQIASAAETGYKKYRAEKQIKVRKRHCWTAAYPVIGWRLRQSVYIKLYFFKLYSSAVSVGSYPVNCWAIGSRRVSLASLSLSELEHNLYKNKLTETLARSLNSLRS